MNFIKVVVNVDARTYLKQILKDDKMIQNKCVEVYQLRCLATNVTAPMGTEPIATSGVSDKVGNIVAKIVDLENEINDLIDKFIDDKQERIKVIEQVDEPLQYAILHKHYVQGMRFREIADEEHYSEIHIAKQHQKAIEKVQRILNSIGKYIEV
jgi:DNA-directed RNA polymerase specialized sigma subunit